MSPKCAALARAAALNRPGDTDCRGRWDIRREFAARHSRGRREIGDSRVSFLNHQEARRVAGEIEPGQHVQFGALDVEDQQVDRRDLVFDQNSRQLAPPPGVFLAGAR